MKARDIAEVFSKYFQSVCSSSCPETFPFITQSTDVLSTIPASDSEVHNDIKRLPPTTSVGLDGMTSFLIRGCSDNFVSVLKFIFSFSLSRNTVPKLR
jgi:hypothetical protein